MKKFKLSKLLFFAVLAAAMLVMSGCGSTDQPADPGIADGFDAEMCTRIHAIACHVARLYNG